MAGPVKAKIKIPTVESHLFDGNNCYDYKIYVCKQVFLKNDLKVVIICPAQFSSTQFNLKTSRIAAGHNVPYDKCINLSVKKQNGEVFEISEKNASQFKNYQRVCCSICQTVIGCIYNDSVALVKVFEDNYYQLLGDGPMVNLTEREIRENAFPQGMLTGRLRFDKSPESLTATELQGIRTAHIKAMEAKNNVEMALPLLQKMRDNGEDDPDFIRDMPDFVFVS